MDLHEKRHECLDSSKFWFTEIGNQKSFEKAVCLLLLGLW